MNLLINPATAFMFFLIAVVFFRRKGATIGQAVMIPLRRSAFVYRPRIRDVFTGFGIALLIVGSLIAFLDVALWVR